MKPDVHASMLKIIERMEDAPKRYAEICGEAVELPSMRVENGTAIIPVNGVMVRGVSMADKIGGVVSMEDIERDVKFAVEDPDVKRIVLDIDSPGGMHNGTPELAQVIAEAAKQKPMAAFSAGTMASAAYYIAAGTGQILTTISALSGSIGVVTIWPDVSGAMKDKGVKIKVFSSGDYKGMTPEVELTEKQTEHLQERVLSLANEFYSHVTGARAGVDQAAFDGRVFMAKEAMSLGLIDGTAQNINEVIKILVMNEEQQERLVALEEQASANAAQLTRIESTLSAHPGAQALGQERQEAHEQDIEALINTAVTKAVESTRSEMRNVAAQEFSKMIASAGQAGPIPDKEPEENLTAQQRTERALLAQARKLKGLE